MDCSCAFPPEKVKLVFDSGKKDRTVFLYIGIDLWWLETHGDTEQLSRSDFREKYSASWRGPLTRKGYCQLERGETTIDVVDLRSSSLASSVRKRVTVRHGADNRSTITFECDGSHADDLISILQTRVRPWKDLVRGAHLSLQHTRTNKDDISATFRDMMRLEIPQASAERRKDTPAIMSGSGSLLLKRAAYIVNLVGDLRHPLKELGEELSNLKEPARSLTWIPFIGGGLGLVANTLDLCAAVAKNKGDRVEANEYGLEIAKRLLGTIRRVLTNKNSSMNSSLSGITKIHSKLEKLLRSLEQYDFKCSFKAVGNEFLKREGPTKVLDGMEKVSRALQALQTDHTDENTSRVHQIATCSYPLCDHPICMDSIRSTLKKTFAVPPPPMHARLDFENAERPEKALKDKLLSRTLSNAVAAVGVKGMGGAGKTTCLIGVACDEQIKDEFADGVLWIQLSMHTKSDYARQVFIDILRYAWYYWDYRFPEVLLNPRTPLEEIVESIAEAFSESKCLFVLDDFWNFQDCERIIMHFLKIVCPLSRILLSTRFENLVELFSADPINVGDLDQKTASDVFDDWRGGEPEGKNEEHYKIEILKLCSNLALAVCIAGANVRRVGSRRVLGSLKGNLANLKRLGHIGPDRQLDAVIQTSLNFILDTGHRQGYQYLAVFNNKARIPNQTLEALWDTDAANVEDRVDLYVEYSLATRKVVTRSYSSNTYYVEFHDRHLEHARYSCRREKDRVNIMERIRFRQEGELLVKLHTLLVEGYERICRNENVKLWWQNEQLDDGYFYENYARHLAYSGRLENLQELVMDYRWMTIRCRKSQVAGLLQDFGLASCTSGEQQKEPKIGRETGGFNSRISHPGLSTEGRSVIKSHEVLSNSTQEGLNLVQGALRAARPVLEEHSDELAFQIIGRLRAHSHDNTRIQRLIDEIRRQEERSWLCPMMQCLESPTFAACAVVHASSLVHGVAVSDKNRLAVVCGIEEGLNRLWDGRESRSLGTLSGPEGSMRWIEVTTGGSHISSGSNDSTIRIWNLMSGECENSFRGHENRVLSVAVTADGSRVFSGSVDRTIRVWNATSGECEDIFRGHKDAVWSVAVSEDSSRVVSGSLDKTIRVWNLKTGECESLFRGHEDRVLSVAITTDGSRVVSGSIDKAIRVWNVANGECEKVLRGHEDTVWSVVLCEDGGRVFSGSTDRTIRVWSIGSGRCESVLRGHEGAVWSVAVTADGSRVVSGSGDATIRVWDRVTERCENVLRGHENSVYSVAVILDGAQVVSGSLDRTVRVWNVGTGESESKVRGHEGRVLSAEVTTDGSCIVSGSVDKTIRLWNTANGKCEKVLRGHEDAVWAVAVTKDCRRVVSGSDDATVRVWNVDSGKCVNVLHGHGCAVWAVAVTADGSRAVSGSVDARIRVWNVGSGECERVLLGHEKNVYAVAISEDGRLVVSGSAEHALRVWNVANGECEKLLHGHSNSVYSVGISEDCRRIVSGSGDKTVRVWSLERGDCLRVIPAPKTFRLLLSGKDLLRWSAAACPELFCAQDGCHWVPPLFEFDSGTVKIAHHNDATTLMSASFDNDVEGVLMTDFEKGRVVVATGNSIFTLEIVDPVENA